MVFEHIPVLLKEAVDYLNVEKGKKYIDATLGGGGYTFEILKKGGIVLGIDSDIDSVDYVKDKFSISQPRRHTSNFQFPNGKNLVLVHGNFSDVENIAHLNNFDKVSGIVFDLGLSSYQIENSGRGFSFRRDEPLDMRMNVSVDKLTAAEILNTWSKEELYQLFSKMGEERFAFNISDNIISARKIKPIEKTSELVGIIEGSVRKKPGIHPATKVFQALRIAVNDEIRNLKAGLKEGFKILDEKGRIVVVSFHSLEDRIVKNYFNLLEDTGKGKVITKKPVLSGNDELKRNIRARSAKLRCIEKMLN